MNRCIGRAGTLRLLVLAAFIATGGTTVQAGGNNGGKGDGGFQQTPFQLGTTVTAMKYQTKHYNWVTIDAGDINDASERTYAEGARSDSYLKDIKSMKYRIVKCKGGVCIKITQMILKNDYDDPQERRTYTLFPPSYVPPYRVY